MTTPQEAMYQEALSAIKSGDRARARDLLTRLLKTEQNNPEIWVWMSAVVDTPKERVFCLKEALKLDPQNGPARRGLTVLGVLPPEPGMSLPGRYHRRSWQARQPKEGPEKPGMTKYQLAVIGGAAIGLIGLVALVVILGTQSMKNKWRNGPYIPKPTETEVIAQIVTPSVTPTPNGTPLPLWMQLKATYTPTPLYVNTAHPRYEDYKIGMRAFQRGEWSSAEIHFKQVFTYEPSADVMFYLGEIYRQQGSPEKALEAYNKALETEPNFAPAYLGRARLQEESSPNAYPAAIADVEKAIELDANFGEAYLELAKFQLKTGEPEAALKTLDQAERVMPDAALVFLSRAEVYQAMGSTAKAMENVRRANQLDVTMLPAYRLMGEVLQSGGDFEGSIQPLETYLSFGPKEASAWVLLAKAYQGVDEQKALNALDQALELDSQLLDAYLQRADLYMKENDAKKALADYQAGVKLDKFSFEASLGIGKAMLAEDQPGDAYMQFERTKGLAKEEKQKAELLYWRGLSLEALDETQAALKNWKDLLEMPEGNTAVEWTNHAQSRIKALVTATPTERVKSPTPKPSSTSTRWPTQTPTSTATRKPTATKKP